MNLLNAPPLRFPASLAFLFFFFSFTEIFSQSSMIPANSPAQILLDRLSLMSGVASPIHPEIKFYSRKDAADYAMALDSASPWIDDRDRRDLQYLFDDNNEFVVDPAPASIRQEMSGPQDGFKLSSGFSTSFGSRARVNNRPLLGVFYRSPANFFEVNTKHFKLRANPLFNFHFGKNASPDDDSSFVFQNQRGIEVRGQVDNKVFFSTNFLETQTMFPEYINRWISTYKAVPGNGLYKRFDSKLFDTKGAFDFNNAQAYVGFSITKHVSLQMGHGRNFIGNGYRSMFLSDFSNNYFYLKLNTRVWKFHYQNLFMELSPTTAEAKTGSLLLDKKYAAMHYLNFKVTPRLAFGFFEATVFHRPNQFEFQYLNPIILYRTVETAIGSPDNVLIGLDGRWDFARNFQFYAQATLDEFNFKYIFKPEQKGWHANKSAAQVGLKYVNVLGINHLDLQLEYNVARPYTYSHFDTLISFTHYHHPLAHPLGANFREAIGILRWQPHRNLTVSARVLLQNYGENTDTLNWGSNPLLSNRTHVQDFGNKIGQGVAAEQLIVGGEINWQIYHNIYFDLRAFHRRKKSDDPALNLETTIFGAGLRMNLWNQNLDF